MTRRTNNPMVWYLGSSTAVGFLVGLMSMWQWGWFAG